MVQQPDHELEVLEEDQTVPPRPEEEVADAPGVSDGPGDSDGLSDAGA